MNLTSVRQGNSDRLDPPGEETHRRLPQDFTGPVNTGNPDEFTIVQLAQRVIELTGSRSQIAFKPLPGDDGRL